MDKLFIILLVLFGIGFIYFLFMVSIQFTRINRINLQLGMDVTKLYEGDEDEPDHDVLDLAENSHDCHGGRHKENRHIVEQEVCRVGDALHLDDPAEHKHEQQHHRADVGRHIDGEHVADLFAGKADRNDESELQDDAPNLAHRGNHRLGDRARVVVLKGTGG